MRRKNSRFFSFYVNPCAPPPRRGRPGSGDRAAAAAAAAAGRPGYFGTYSRPLYLKYIGLKKWILCFRESIQKTNYTDLSDLFLLMYTIFIFQRCT